jgi:hypothetical protein
MAIAEFLVQALFELPAAGIASTHQRTTRMGQHTAELVANMVIIGIMAGAGLIAWSVSQST